MNGPVLLTASWVVGHRDGRHCLYPNGEIVVDRDRVVSVQANTQGRALTDVLEVRCGAVWGGS